MSVLRLALWIVAVVSVIVGRDRRAEWRREWRSELIHAARTSPWPTLLRRGLLSLGDAWSLRQRARRPPAAVGPVLAGLSGDVRYAVRTLRRNPGFAAVALLTFGLGIGMNATVFGAVDAVLFRPLPYARPDALVAVDVEPGASVSKATLSELRRRTRAFEGLAGWSRWGFTWTGAGPAQVVTGVRSTADLLGLLGAVPVLGRLSAPGDDAPEAGPTAVASWGFWRTHMGGDPAAVGRTLQLDGVAHTLVGVTGPDFAFPDGDAELFLPAPLDPSDESDWTAGYLRVAGRLRDGVGAEAARADVRAALAALVADGGAARADFGAAAEVGPLRDALVGSARAPLLALLAAVGFVLLVACANLASLMLARTTARQAELAARRALGASSWRVARQLLVESMVLAAAGVLLGLALARAGLELAQALLPPELPGADAVRLDIRVVLATVCAAVSAAVLAGLVPGLRAAARAAPAAALRERAGTGAAALLRTQSALVAAEAALAVLLVAAAGAAMSTVRALLRADTGYAPAGVLTVMAMPPAARYGDDAALLVYWDEALAALRAIPGVGAAGGIHLAPFGGSDWNPELVVEGRPVAPGERRPAVGWRVVTPGWFATAGVRLLEGRDFDGRDRAGGVAVAIVNQTLARRFWPDGSAPGRRVRTFFEDGQWVEIVGVVGDTRDVALDRDVRPQIYRPHTQFTTGSLMLAVHADGSDATLAASMRAALESIDDDVPLVDLRPLHDRIGASVARERLVARLLGVFAALALVLGAIGIYGVTAWAVSRRRRELGVRSALGASGADLTRLVLGQTTRVAAAGSLAGALLAVIAGRGAATRIANVILPGPALLAASAGTLLVVALLAAWLPARRASRIDPQQALRED